MKSSASFVLESRQARSDGKMFKIETFRSRTWKNTVPTVLLARRDGYSCDRTKGVFHEFKLAKLKLERKSLSKEKGKGLRS